MATAPFQIIKNAPPPPPARLSRYPFAQMDVGDAFDVRWEDRRTIQPQASNWGKRIGCKFVTRKIDADTLRVWRVA